VDSKRPDNHRPAAVNKSFISVHYVYDCASYCIFEKGSVTSSRSNVE
jgi:hypothetical protein